MIDGRGLMIIWPVWARPNHDVKKTYIISSIKILYVNSLHPNTPPPFLPLSPSLELSPYLSPSLDLFPSLSLSLDLSPSLISLYIYSKHGCMLANLYLATLYI